MSSQRGETWRFRVREPSADRVFLVRYSDQDTSEWTTMKQAEPGVWELTRHLDAGRHRFGYFTCEGAAYFNAGTFGLCAQRVGEPDPRVEVAPLPPVADDAPVSFDGTAADADDHPTQRYGPSSHAM